MSTRRHHAVWSATASVSRVCEVEGETLPIMLTVHEVNENYYDKNNILFQELGMMAQA